MSESGQARSFGDVSAMSGLLKSGHDWAIYEYTPWHISIPCGRHTRTCVEARDDGIPQPFPPFTTRRRMSAGGRSGGRAGGRSAKRAPHDPRGSSRHGQSADSRTIRSSRRISAPYFTARRAVGTGALADVATQPDQHVGKVHEPANTHGSHENKEETKIKQPARARSPGYDSWPDSRLYSTI
jgi:hypothetical protein